MNITQEESRPVVVLHCTEDEALTIRFALHDYISTFSGSPDSFFLKRARKMHGQLLTEMKGDVR